MFKDLVELEHGDLDWKSWASGIAYFCFAHVCNNFDKKHQKFNSLNDALNYEIDVTLKFSKHRNAAEKVVLAHSYEESIKINKIVSEISNKYCDNSTCFFSDLYEGLKKRATKTAFRSILTPGSGVKKSDEALLTTTQFFTDGYMASHLIKKTMNLASNRNVRIIDLACGGGNFLTQALDILFNSQTEHEHRVENVLLVKELFESSVFGYDLDPMMVELTRMSLFAKGCELCGELLDIVPDVKEYDSEFGFFDINQNSDLNLPQGDFVNIYLTNPPFAGKRDISSDLRDFLNVTYPSAKGDLCVSFFENMMNIMGKDDIVGIVSQRSWMYLKSYSDFRYKFYDDFKLVSCVDLGARAFKNITGEKTSVALVTVKKNIHRERYTTNFYSLVSLSYQEKCSVLLSEVDASAAITVDLRDLEIKGDNSFKYYFGSHTLNLIKNSYSYSDFALPMQGTSTGDHKKFIDVAWRRKDDPDWVPVSKGGGFCKWNGLNHYSIKWGKNGEFIRKQKGSALRNLDKLEAAQLVYSDTGTLGLNVRLKKEGQIFVASGPGILVKEGDVYSHLAFLNSLFSSYMIRNLTPKLSISAGYIGSLPITDKIIFDTVLSDLAQIAVSVKKRIQRNLIVDYDYSNSFLESSSYNINTLAESLLVRDLQLSAKMHHAECDINSRISLLLGLPNKKIEKINQWIFVDKSYGASEFSFEKLDQLISSSINSSTEYKGTKSKGALIGQDNIMSLIVPELGCSSDYILGVLEGNMHRLPNTLMIYIEDILHKVILDTLGFNSILDWNTSVEDFSIIKQKLELSFCDLDSVLRNQLGINLSSWLSIRLPTVHTEAFKKDPILYVSNNFLKLE